jgi:hypothetical protein
VPPWHLPIQTSRQHPPSHASQLMRCVKKYKAKSFAHRNPSALEPAGIARPRKTVDSPPHHARQPAPCWQERLSHQWAKLQQCNFVCATACGLQSMQLYRCVPGVKRVASCLGCSPLALVAKRGGPSGPTGPYGSTAVEH